MRATTRRMISAVSVFGLVAAGCGSEKSDSKTTTATTAAATTAAPTTAAATTTAAGATTTAKATTTTSNATTTAKATATSSAAAADVKGDVVVLAAASLTKAFTDIGDAFAVGHPDANVKLSFGPSSGLVTQIVQGAPADVFASADAANMTKLTDAGGNAGEPIVFATNVLQIIVAPGNPKNIQTLADLAEPGMLYVTAGPDVPVAKYAKQVLDKGGVAVTPVSEEVDVKGIVTKVSSGEADAGIVYKTDVLAAGTAAEGVDIPPDLNVIATYPIVATKEATNPTGAAAFIQFVLGDQGQKALEAAGFTPPPS